MLLSESSLFNMLCFECFATYVSHHQSPGYAFLTSLDFILLYRMHRSEIDFCLRRSMSFFFLIERGKASRSSMIEPAPLSRKILSEVADELLTFLQAPATSFSLVLRDYLPV